MYYDDDDDVTYVTYDDVMRSNYTNISNGMNQVIDIYYLCLTIQLM